MLRLLLCVAIIYLSGCASARNEVSGTRVDFCDLIENAGFYDDVHLTTVADVVVEFEVFALRDSSCGPYMLPMGLSSGQIPGLEELNSRFDGAGVESDVEVEGILRHDPHRVPSAVFELVRVNGQDIE